MSALVSQNAMTQLPDDFQSALRREREQLLECWANAFKRNPDWFSNEVVQLRNILRLVQDEPSPKRNIGLSDNIRKFHDRLGFMAKGRANEGGLCAGAIYRSTRFIGIEHRSGARHSQNVHIEHTIPIRILRHHLIAVREWETPNLLMWLLDNSVATAITIEEKNLIAKPLRDHSFVFDSTSESYLRPFMRYNSLFASGTVVWNVFDGVAVDQSFELLSHKDVLVRLMRQIGAASMCRRWE